MTMTAERRQFERRRNVRKHEVKSRTLTPRDLRRHLRIVEPPLQIDNDRPKNRTECVGGHRPCPYVSCRHHLYLDVHPKTGSVKVNRPDLEPEDLEVSCSLDVADAGGDTLERVADLMNLTRERVRQIEGIAFRKATRGLKEFRESE